MDIGNGDFVAYIGPVREGSVATIGQVCHVVGRAIEPGYCRSCGRTTLGILLAELWSHRNPEGAFCPNHWRPIYRPKAKMIEGLLQPIKEDA